MSWITELARPEIVKLKAYEHAVWEPTLERLNANELPWRALGDNSIAGLNRYPEPQPLELIERLAALYEVRPESLLTGRGSNEMIDLLMRVFCRAGQDGIIICPPTFGMYAVSARIQGAEVVTAPLQAERGFSLDEASLLDRCTSQIKLVFLCSPNNPTGNLLDEETILRIASRLEKRALLVVDEAYVEFAGAPSLTRHLERYPQLVLLRTLSKAHGLAGARCGSLIAHSEITALLQKVIPPYSIPQLTMEAVLQLLQPPSIAVMRNRVDELREERKKLIAGLRALPNTLRVWPSDANFVLAEFSDPDKAIAGTRAANLLIRDFRGQSGLNQVLRISVGTPEQNARLLEGLR